MNNDLNCDIVRDLLPSYADGLTGEATKSAIEAHLALCADCRAALGRMREPEPPRPLPVELDYLKKVRRRSGSRAVIVGICLMLLGMGLLLFRYFYVGSAAGASDAAYSVTVDGDAVTVSGTLTSSGLGVARVVFSESAGMVEFRVYTAPKAFFNSGDFTADYTAHTDVAQVRVKELIVWENGVEISPTASRLFAAVNPFAGDMPANERVADILGVSGQLGPYTNELQTAEEPFGWSILLDNALLPAQESAARDIMAADAYVMLAAVENLGYVSWRYDCGGESREYTVTLEDASMYMGRDIKFFASSAQNMQALVGSLSIKWSGVRESGLTGDTFRVTIENSSGADIYGLGIQYYLAGALVGGGNVVNANGEAFGDEDVSFDFTAADFPAGTSAIELADFSFDLTVMDANGTEIPVCRGVAVPARRGWTFAYVLTGDYDAGFELSD